MEERKKTYLCSGRADTDTLQEDMDYGSCRGGVDEYKERMKKKTYGCGWTDVLACKCGCAGCGWWLTQMSIREKEENRKQKQKIYWIVDVDGCGPKNADDLC